MNIFSVFFKKRKPLAEVPDVNGIGDDYFFRMMSPQATSLAKSYEEEEGEVLKKLVNTIQDVNINAVVVGAGTLWYVDLFLNKLKKYIAVEPLAKLFLNKQIRFLIKQFPQIKVVEKRFNDLVAEDIENENKLMVFIFNILAYIDNPMDQINYLLKKGDILFFSSWNRTREARQLRKQYFDYLNSFEKDVIIDSEKTIGLCNLENFPFNELKHYERHVRIKGKITDILIIYT